MIDFEASYSFTMKHMVPRVENKGFYDQAHAIYDEAHGFYDEAHGLWNVTKRTTAFI